MAECEAIETNVCCWNHTVYVIDCMICNEVRDVCNGTPIVLDHYNGPKTITLTAAQRTQYIDAVVAYRRYRLTGEIDERYRQQIKDIVMAGGRINFAAFEGAELEELFCT